MMPPKMTRKKLIGDKEGGQSCGQGSGESAKHWHWQSTRTGSAPRRSGGTYSASVASARDENESMYFMAGA